MTATAVRPAPAARVSRMTLSAVKPTRQRVPDKIVLMGTPGIGKSTFAADSTAPIFIAAEEGLSHLDVQAFPEPQSFADVLDAVRTLRADAHDYKTCVLDTVDWIEPLIWSDLCVRNKWDTIEAPGYGKGYAVALDEWRKLIVELDGLRRDRGMEIILLAHSQIKTFQNPAGSDYSRYEPKLHRGAAALLQEWCSVSLFATHEEFTKKDGARVKGISTGRRVMHTQRTAAWDAKSRHNLPEVLPLSYAAYAEARDNDQVAPPDVLYAEAVALLDEWAPPADKRAEVAAFIDTNKANAAELAKAVDTLRSRVAEKE